MLGGDLDLLSCRGSRADRDHDERIGGEQGGGHILAVAGRSHVV